MVKSYTTAAAVGLILGFVMVWWVRPDTNAGAIFLVIATVLLCFVFASIFPVFGRFFRKRNLRPTRVPKHDDIT